MPALNQLLLPFLSLVTDSELRRNPTVKAELAASQRPMSGLMLTYPVHQAADILFCKANVVPVGKDQLPHLEQTRVVARRFDEAYATVFPQPDALLSEAPNILGTDGAEDEQVARQRHRDRHDAPTRPPRSSSGPSPTPTGTSRTTRSPVPRSPTCCSRLAVPGARRRAGPTRSATAVPARLKAVVTEAVNDHFAPIRARRAELEADQGHLVEVLAAGNARANEVADATLDEVRAAMGMRYDLP